MVYIFVVKVLSDTVRLWLVSRHLLPALTSRSPYRPADESWLEVSSDQLEQLLQQQFELQQQPPQQVAAELQEFLSRLSGLDGVESEPAGGASASRKTSRARKVSGMV